MDYMARLRSSLAAHPEAVASTAAALWARTGHKIKAHDLEWARGLGTEDDEQLLWDALEEIGAITQGVLDPEGLQRFLDELVLGQPSAEGRSQTSIVWTLPEQHPAAKLRGRSLLSAAVSLIQQSNDTLLLTAPFIDKKGFGVLMESLESALARGVEVTILSHNLLDIASLASASVEGLRQSAQQLPGKFKIYSAVVNSDAPRAEHPLLHAKLIIADDNKALVSSANLTIYGLTSNFEVGVLVNGDEVVQLSNVMQSLLKCRLTSFVASD
ncbi:MAG: hypothetical protein IBX64_10285 [Actinobacteria bacterium]|nr:hypothetical protein [Actinomycetota bacterium]